MEAAGATVVGTSDHTVTHSLYILDPDGNELELYIDVPGVDWRRTRPWWPHPSAPWRSEAPGPAPPRFEPVRTVRADDGRNRGRGRGAGRPAA